MAPNNAKRFRRLLRDKEFIAILRMVERVGLQLWIDSEDGFESGFVASIPRANGNVIVMLVDCQAFTEPYVRLCPTSFAAPTKMMVEGLVDGQISVPEFATLAGVLNTLAEKGLPTFLDILAEALDSEGSNDDEDDEDDDALESLTMPHGVRRTRESLTSAIDDLFSRYGGAPEEVGPDRPFGSALLRLCDHQHAVDCAAAIDSAAHKHVTPRGLRLAGYAMSHAADFLSASDRLYRSIDGTRDPVAVCECIAGCLLAVGRNEEALLYAKRSDRSLVAEIWEEYSEDLAWLMAVSNAIGRPPALGESPYAEESQLEVLGRIAALAYHGIVDPNNVLAQCNVDNVAQFYQLFNRTQGRTGLALWCKDVRNQVDRFVRTYGLQAAFLKLQSNELVLFSDQ